MQGECLLKEQGFHSQLYSCTMCFFFPAPHRCLTGPALVHTGAPRLTAPTTENSPFSSLLVSLSTNFQAGIFS